MTSLIAPGSKCLLDGKTEVIVLKPSTRSNLSYTVEIPGKSIELVSSDRLSTFTQTSPQAKAEEIFEYDE
jgi:hypothetical protein